MAWIKLDCVIQFSAILFIYSFRYLMLVKLQQNNQFCFTYNKHYSDYTQWYLKAGNVIRMGTKVDSFSCGHTLIGGNFRIFRPCLPDLRCHKPDRGRLPSSRFFCTLPMCVSAWSTFDTRPTVAIHFSLYANSFLSGICTTTRLSYLRKIVPNVPAARMQWPLTPAILSKQWILVLTANAPNG